MTPCRECGRVNPPEASYCMTCATRLGKESGTMSGENPRWRTFGREETTQDTTRSYSAGSSSGDDGRLEKLTPFLEDFVFDMVRAGARLYFAAKDPNPPQGTSDARGKDPGLGERYERLKDVIAEARMEYRRKGPSSGKRNER